MYLSLSLSLWLCFFFGQVMLSPQGSPPLRKKSDQMSQRSSLKDRSLNVFFKCICHCLCHRLSVGQVMFSHDPHHLCEVLVWYARLEGSEFRTVSQ